MDLTPVTWQQLISAFPDDRYLNLRTADPGTIRRAAVGGSTWSTRTRSEYWESDWVMMYSASDDATVRASETAQHLAWHVSFEDGDSIGGMTFADHTAIPDGRLPEVSSAWSWFWTDSEHARVDIDRKVVTVDHHDPRLLEVLSHSDTASHERDGKAPDVWFGLEAEGQLVCVAAVNKQDDATYLQSVVTHTQHRGCGYARRVCSHATAWSLQQVRYATLGMMSDNKIARALYESLGYSCDKEFRSVKFKGLQLITCD